MESQIKTHTYPNGEIQRVQTVKMDDWSSLDFLTLAGSDRALDRFSGIYRDFLVPSAPWLFGNLIMFRLPPESGQPLCYDTTKYGKVADPLTIAAAVLKDGVKIIAGRPVFLTKSAHRLWLSLEKYDCLRIISGRLPTTTVIPLGELSGYLSETCQNASLKVNASFFIMDRFDCASVYDHVGTPFGLCVKDGVVSRPPLYNREALLVDRSGKVSIRPMDIKSLKIEINGQVFLPGENADIYTRPDHFRNPFGKGLSIVVIGSRVAAVGCGSLAVPASGFLLCPRNECHVSPGDSVTYKGLEQIQFGIQVGNSILINGEKTKEFLSPFYNIRRGQPVPYPPSLYPMDFHNARAARIALGADKTGKPMLLWAEGAAKFGYSPGKGSCGASLSELADLCADAGMVNAVNLDGGGSAQILVNSRRSLQISDRNPTDFSEAERPVPFGLIVK